MLTLQKFPVRDVAFAARTVYERERLTIDREALRQELLDDERLADVDIELVAPDERARIINIVDVLEPRIKPDLDPPNYYPGAGTDPFLTGSGRTNVLAGATVMTTALLDQAEDMVVSCEPELPLRSRFASCWNVVVSPSPAPNVSDRQFAEAVGAAGCRAAVALARATLGLDPEEILEVGGEPAEGPRIAYICFLYSHGFGRQKLVYGRGSAGMLPTVIPLAHLLDGAVIDQGYTRPVRNTTYEIVNNAVALELANGPGVILVPHATELRYKIVYAQMAAALAKEALRCEGVIITKDGGGQADVDLMQAIRACESLGLPTVAAVFEIAGEDGALLPLVTTVDEADALVTLGNGSAPMRFAPIERVLGGPKFGRAVDDPHGSFAIPSGQVPGLMDMMGGTLVRASVF